MARYFPSLSTCASRRSETSTPLSLGAARFAACTFKSSRSSEVTITSGPLSPRTRRNARMPSSGRTPFAVLRRRASSAGPIAGSPWSGIGSGVWNRVWLQIGRGEGGAAAGNRSGRDPLHLESKASARSVPSVPMSVKSNTAARKCPLSGPIKWRCALGWGPPASVRSGRSKHSRRYRRAVAPKLVRPRGVTR